MSEEQEDFAVEYIMQLQDEKYKFQQESKQLKNILTELEKWLNTFKITYNTALGNVAGVIEVVQNKIQELKEKYK